MPAVLLYGVPELCVLMFILVLIFDLVFGQHLSLLENYTN